MKYKISVIVIYWLLFQFTAAAHPHMFFSNRYHVEEEQGQIKGIRVDWIFDIYFTQEIVFDYDLDQNGKFSPTETQDVHDYAFINLAKYNYFQLIRQGDKRYTVESISDFTVFMEGKHLVYQFYVSLEDIPPGDIWLATYDPTFFCAIDYAEEQAVFLEKGSDLQFAMEENDDYPVYYDPWGAPTESPIYEKWEPGLETFIPTEVHLWYE